MRALLHCLLELALLICCNLKDFFPTKGRLSKGDYDIGQLQCNEGMAQRWALKISKAQARKVHMDAGTTRNAPFSSEPVQNPNLSASDNKVSAFVASKSSLTARGASSPQNE